MKIASVYSPLTHWLLWAAAFTTIVGLAASYGCGKSHEQETARVFGTVTLDGQPVTTGWVYFTPQSGRAAKGTIGPDGKFMLGTYSTNDGAIVGLHQVTIIAREEGPQDSELPGKSLIPERFASSTDSGLSFNVRAGEIEFVKSLQ